MSLTSEAVNARQPMFPTSGLAPMRQIVDLAKPLAGMVWVKKE